VTRTPSPGEAAEAPPARRVRTAGPESGDAVVNETDRITVSLHIYGKHVNYTIRSQFDPTRNEEKPFILKVDSWATRTAT
jgi:hypothetical protein